MTSPQKILSPTELAQLRAEVLSLRFVCSFCAAETALTDAYVDMGSGAVACTPCHLAEAGRRGVVSMAARRMRHR